MYLPITKKFDLTYKPPVPESSIKLALPLWYISKSALSPKRAFDVSVKVISSLAETARSVPPVVFPFANTCARVGWKLDVFNCDKLAYLTISSLESWNIILSSVASPTPVPSVASSIILPPAEPS